MNRTLAYGMRLPAGLVVCALALSGCITTSDSRPPVESEPTEAATFNMQLGANYLRTGNLEMAKEKLEKALMQDPTLADAHTYAALLYDAIEEVDKADFHYQRSLKLAPGDSATLNLYGAFLCRHDRVDEADKYFVAATRDQLYRTPEAALTNAGICVLRVPSRSRAEAYFREALENNPRYPDALWQMARLSYEQDQPLQARAFLERFAAQQTMGAESLWLGVQIESELGDRPAAREYGLRLESEFPDAVETGKWRELAQ